MSETDARSAGRPLRMLLTGAIVLAGLYFLRELLIPVVLAVLLAFLLAPAVRWVQRSGLGRMPAVLCVVLLALSLLGAGVWFVGAEAVDVGRQLPEYKHTLRARAQSLRDSITRTVMPVSQAISEIREEMTEPASRPSRAGKSAAAAAPRAAAETAATVATDEPAVAAATDEPAQEKPAEKAEKAALLQLSPALLATLLHPFAVLGLTGVIALFFLTYREDLRDRIIRLCGDAHISLTTSMLTDAGARFSRYFGGLVAVNALTGAAIAGGLFALGVPNALLFGVLTALLRFVPFLGPWLAALFPIGLTLAVFDGWAIPAAVVGLFLLVELIGANLLEPLVYGARIGASPTAILLSMIFWTWLWGAVGLLLATPITVCLVVLGKYVPQMQWLYVLLGNEAVLQPHARFYQRLLALEPDDAIRVFRETAGADRSAAAGFTEVVTPALSLLAAEPQNGAHDAAREQAARQVVEQLLRPLERREPPEAGRAGGGDAGGAVLLPVRGCYDELAAQIVARLHAQRGGGGRVPASNLLISELIESMRDEPAPTILLLSVQADNIRRIELLCKRIRAARPDAAVLIGLWDAGAEPGRVQHRLRRMPHVTLCPTPEAALEALDRVQHQRAIAAAAAPVDTGPAPVMPALAAPAGTPG